jgi:hypothetical protein
MKTKQVIRNESFVLISKLQKLGINISLTPEQLSKYIINKLK